MRHIPTNQIDQLVGRDKEDYNSLVLYVNSLYGTPAYNELATEVENLFGNLQTIVPGTVGAYFGGCLAAEKNKDSTCSAACAGNMPFSNNFCKYTVIIANKQGSNHSFKTVHDVGTKEAFIYIQDGQQLTSSDIDHLKNQGIEKVYLTYNPFSPVNLNQNTAFVPLDTPDIVGGVHPTPNVPPSPPTPPADNWNYILLLTVLVLLIAILIIIVAGSQRRNGATG